MDVEINKHNINNNTEIKNNDEIKTHTYPECITLHYSMNIRDFHCIYGKIIGRMPQFSKTPIQEVFYGGENGIWGRVSEGSWLCLELGGQYFTSWKM